MKLLLLGLLIVTLVSIYMCFRYKEGLVVSNRPINLQADPANDYEYNCTDGSTYATYNAETLTQGQNEIVRRNGWDKKGSSYYACKQGCESTGNGTCSKNDVGVMGINGRLGGWIKSNSRPTNLQGVDNNEKGFINSQDEYWKNRKYGDLGDASNWLELKENFEVNKELVPEINSNKQSVSEIAEKIEKCRTLTSCKDLVNNDCGYCYQSNKFMYGDANGPAADVCPAKGWAPPGEKAEWWCEKIKSQAICKKVKDCGGTTGEANICGWCPTSNQALVMGDSHTVTENTIKRWVTGSCQSLPGQADQWCAGGANATRERCEAPKGSSGSTTSFYTDDYWFWQNITCPNGATKTLDHNGWSPWLMHHAHCKKTSPPIPKRVRCYWEEEMHSKVVPIARDVKWPKYFDDWKKCKNGVSKEMVQDEANFKPGLVPPGQCAEFKQEFPCMGPNILTGPHSGDCLQSLWKNSGCTGNLSGRISASGLNSTSEFNWWNTHSYADTQANMYSFANKATSSNYDEAKVYTKACYNEPVDPCDPKFNPRPKECTEILYKDMGGNPDGELNPKNQNNWPNEWVGDDWKNQGSWSIAKYQNKVADAASNAKVSTALSQINPEAHYDNAVKFSMQISGNKPTPPFAKPCWKDILNMYKSLKWAGKNITISGSDYIDFSRDMDIRNRLSIPDTNDWSIVENGGINFYNMSIYKVTYENANFPYWDMVWYYRETWRNNWETFSGILGSVTGVNVSRDGTYIAVAPSVSFYDYMNDSGRPAGTSSKKCAADFGTSIPCCGQADRTYATNDKNAAVPPRDQCDAYYPICNDYVFDVKMGYCGGNAAKSITKNDYMNYMKGDFPYAFLVNMVKGS